MKLLPKPMDINSLRSFIDFLRVEKGAASNTIAAYKRDLEKFVEWRLEHPDASLQEYAKLLSSLAPASVERNFSAIRSFYSFLEREFNEKNPCDELPETIKRTRLPKALTVEEVSRILENSKDPNDPISLRDYLILELLYSTGARVSEVVGINLNDLNTSQVGGDEIKVLKLRGKGGKERLVPLGSFAIAALDDYLVRTRPNLQKGTNEGALILNNRGGRLSRVSAWEVVKRAAAKVGLEARVTPHVFRHSYATHLLDGGADIRVVQELLGHASVTTTQIYTLITIDKVRESYRLAHPRA